jgi:large repetitive protein
MLSRSFAIRSTGWQGRQAMIQNVRRWARRSSGLGLALLAFACVSVSALAGPVGPEFRVNTYTESPQVGGAVARLADGFVVVWISSRQDGSSWDIYGQRFTLAGEAHGQPFRINSRTNGSQLEPAVAGLSGGGFVAAWVSPDPQGGQYAKGVYSRRYDAKGAPAGPEFQVNTNGDTIERPAIAGLNGGGFVIAWNSLAQDGSLNGVYAQRFKDNGAKAGSEFRVNTQTANNQQNSGVGALSDGGFVIAWRHRLAVHAQRFDAAGRRISGEFIVDTGNTVSSTDTVGVAGLGNGGFAIAWRAHDGQRSIYGRRYNATGTAIGAKFAVTSDADDSTENVTVSALSSGGFVVVWQTGIFRHYNILARSYTSNAVALSEPTVIKAETAGGPSVAGLSNGTFVVTWTSVNKSEQPSGVYARRWRP